MKKIILSLFIIAIFHTLPSFADEFFGIGAELAQDTYNKKIIVVKLMDNKPAARSGVNVGDEIIAVDGDKVAKKPICEVISKIRGGEGVPVKLRIKRNFFIRKNIIINRERIFVDCPCGPSNSKWVQIVEAGYFNPKPIDDRILKKFSRKYQNTTALKLKYWQKRKEIFELGYNDCMNYSPNNREVCLIHLLDRENAKTNADKTLYKFLRAMN